MWPVSRRRGQATIIRAVGRLWFGQRTSRRRDWLFDGWHAWRLVFDFGHRHLGSRRLNGCIKPRGSNLSCRRSCRRRTGLKAQWIGFRGVVAMPDKDRGWWLIFASLVVLQRIGILGGVRTFWRLPRRPFHTAEPRCRADGAEKRNAKRIMSSKHREVDHQEHGAASRRPARSRKRAGLYGSPLCRARAFVYCPSSTVDDVGPRASRRSFACLIGASIMRRQHRFRSGHGVRQGRSVNRGWACKTISSCGFNCVWGIMVHFSRRCALPSHRSACESLWNRLNHWNQRDMAAAVEQRRQMCYLFSSSATSTRRCIRR
jgi:hypothetical protein